MSKPDKKYKGVIVPMISPLNKDLSIDELAVEMIVQTFWQNSIEPFVLGTTGESVSLSVNQKNNLVKYTIKAMQGKGKTFAGISGNSLFDSIEEAKRYTDLGVDAVVAHLPFYYPISADQMLKYYEKLAESLKCDLFLYNNPITTNISIPIEVIDKLSYHPNIVGIKDSERGQERLDESIKNWADRADFVHLLGWAAQSAYSVLNGSDGIVPSTANITPSLYKELYDAALMGDFKKAFEIQETTNKVSEIYQKNRKLNESLPALKLMMSFYGLCKPYVMPPMQMLGETSDEEIKEAMVIEMSDLL